MSQVQAFIMALVYLLVICLLAITGTISAEAALTALGGIMVGLPLRPQLPPRLLEAGDPK